MAITDKKKFLYNIKIVISILFPFEITIRIQKQSGELADHTLNINGLTFRNRASYI